MTRVVRFHFILSRLLQVIPVFLGTTLLVYFHGLRPTRRPDCSALRRRQPPQSVIDALRAQYNLDQPFWVQYGLFIKNFSPSTLALTSPSSPSPTPWPGLSLSRQCSPLKPSSSRPCSALPSVFSPVSKGQVVRLHRPGRLASGDRSPNLRSGLRSSSSCSVSSSAGPNLLWAPTPTGAT